MAVRRFKESRKDKETRPEETPDIPRHKKMVSQADQCSTMKYGEPAQSAHEPEGCLSSNEKVQSRCQQTRDTHRVQEVDTVSTDRFSNDSPPDYSSDELDSDDIVAYDMETSRYTTVADQTRRERRDFR